jgi:Zn-dependent protease/predicted transcriptional regulator
MRSHIKLGRIGGIEIGLHYSWFIIAILIALSLAAHFHQVQPGWSETVVWAASIITSALFFVTLLLHELAHSLVAKSRGLRVRAITLFALGGVSQIETEASDAKTEFWIAIVGPLTSFAIGLVLLGLAWLMGWRAGQAEAIGPVGAVLLWLGYINIALGAFNMIPGFPLDGGRVLRAIVWWVVKKADRATRIAAQVGQVVAFLFILYGLYRFFVGANFGGLWLAFIGWFLLDAARSSYMQVGLMAGLRGQRVGDIMESDCTRVEGYLSLRDFVEKYVLHSATRCFVVMQNDHVAGIVTASDARRVSRENWDQTSVQSIMRPLSTLRTVSPDMPAMKALELMGRENLNQLAVVVDGQLKGIFSRSQVLRFMQIHAGIGQDSHDMAA